MFKLQNIFRIKDGSLIYQLNSDTGSQIEAIQTF